MINMKPRVGFICVHNSCRSQIAEALVNMGSFNIQYGSTGGSSLEL